MNLIQRINLSVNSILNLNPPKLNKFLGLYNRYQSFSNCNQTTQQKKYGFKKPTQDLHEWIYVSEIALWLSGLFQSISQFNKTVFTFSVHPPLYNIRKVWIYFSNIECYLYWNLMHCWKPQKNELKCPFTHIFLDIVYRATF